MSRASAGFCPERKEPTDRGYLSRSWGWDRPEDARTRGWEGGEKVKIEALSLFVSKTVCRQVRACSSQRNTQTHTHTHARRLIYGCGYFTTSATHIPFGGANEKHWKVGFPLSIFLYRGRNRYKWKEEVHKIALIFGKCLSACVLPGMLLVFNAKVFDINRQSHDPQLNLACCVYNNKQKCSPILLL